VYEITADVQCQMTAYAIPT